MGTEEEEGRGAAWEILLREEEEAPIGRTQSLSTEDPEGEERPEVSQGSVAPPRPTERIILVFGE